MHLKISAYFFSPLRKLVPFIVKLWKCSILKLSSLSSLQHSKTSLLTILSPRQRVEKETELTRTHSANMPSYVHLFGHMALWSSLMNIRQHYSGMMYKGPEPEESHPLPPAAPLGHREVLPCCDSHMTQTTADLMAWQSAHQNQLWLDCSHSQQFRVTGVYYLISHGHNKPEDGCLLEWNPL